MESPRWVTCGPVPACAGTDVLPYGEDAMDYLVSPVEAPDWVLDAKTLDLAISSRWTVEAYGTPGDYAYSDFWRVHAPHHTLEVGLRKNGQTIGLDGRFFDCAEFALWLRMVLPSVPTVVFYDQGMSGMVELKESTTLDEVAGMFGVERE